ncbi:MAG: gamma-glutamyl-gamma-aminobutyrate hydrolase family protein [Bacillota bacterium]
MHRTVVGITLPQRGIAGYERYFTAVERAGATPVPLCGPETDLSGVDAILFSGGGDLAWAKGRYSGEADAAKPLSGIDPERNERELALARIALARQMKILGVCRGLQVISCVLGGELYADIERCTGLSPEKERHQKFADRDAQHIADFRAGSLLHGWFGAEAVVNSAHHQAVSVPGRGLAVTGRSREGIVEALEHENGRVLLVQWHPERWKGMEPLFDWLAQGC